MGAGLRNPKVTMEAEKGAKRESVRLLGSNGICWGYIGVMGKKVNTTTGYWGYSREYEYVEDVFETSEGLISVLCLIPESLLVRTLGRI